MANVFSTRFDCAQNAVVLQTILPGYQLSACEGLQAISGQPQRERLAHK